MFYQHLIIDAVPYIANIMEFSFRMPPHWHNEIEIIYCISGSFKTRINDIEYSVEAGQAVFVNSLDIHEYYQAVPDTEILLLEIGPLLIKQNFEKLSERTFIQTVLDIDNNETSDLLRLFDIIIGEIESRLSAEAEWNIRGCLYSLSSLMLRSLMCEDSQYHKQKKQKTEAMQKVCNAISYVQENYFRDITVEKISKMFGYEKSNFCKVFKSATHMTFHKYLNHARINMACLFLKEINEPVASIAEKTGFRETKTFCRVFKEIVNMTPTEFRNSVKSAEFKYCS